MSAAGCSRCSTSTSISASSRSSGADWISAAMSEQGQLGTDRLVQVLDPAVVVPVDGAVLRLEAAAVFVLDAVGLGVVLDVDHGEVLAQREPAAHLPGPFRLNLPAKARGRAQDCGLYLLHARSLARRQ